MLRLIEVCRVDFGVVVNGGVKSEKSTRFSGGKNDGINKGVIISVVSVYYVGVFAYSISVRVYSMKIAPVIPLRSVVPKSHGARCNLNVLSVVDETVAVSVVGNIVPNDVCYLSTQ